MKLKHIFTLILLIAFVSTSSLIADEDQDKKIKGKIKVGAAVAENTDYIGKVGEYLPLKDGVRPVVKASLFGSLKKIFFDLNAFYGGDSSDQNYSLNLDFNRILTQKLSYDSLIHRLDNDPLTNMDTVSDARSGVFHTNFAPDKQYMITRSEFISETTFNVPGLPAHFYVNYRDEKRDGHYQARTLSKCASCHVVGKSREINSSTKDFQLGGALNFGTANFDYSYTNRRFRENAGDPTHTYLDTLHPELVKPVFNSRISYDQDNGALAFDVVPDTDKNTHQVKANLPISDAVSLYAQYVNTNVINNYTKLEINSHAFAGAFAAQIGSKGLFTARFNQISIDNDSVFVDIFEPVDVAGPKAGLTYVQAYPSYGEADWTRYSSLSRNTLDITANFKYKFSKKINARLGYIYRKIDRDNFEVSQTKSSTFKANLDIKPSRQFSLKLAGRLKATSQPFTNLYSALAPSIQDWNPGSPFAGTQFSVFHEARQAHLTNVATDMTEFKASATWSPSYKIVFTGNFLYRDEKNDELNFSVWENNTIQYGVNAWFLPAERLDITAAYYFYGQDLNSLFAIPVLEGCGGGIIGGFPGTLTDAVDFNMDTNTLFLNLNYTINSKWSLYGNLSYNKSDSAMANLSVSMSDMPFDPSVPVGPLDVEGLTESVDYSDLSIKQMISETGLKYNFSDSWAVNGSMFYYIYDDLAPYLYDTTGNSLAFYLTAIYNF